MDLLCITFETQNINLAPIIAATIAAFIVIIGWFIVAYFNRKNEIAKELRGYRLDMLNSILRFIDAFLKNREIFRADIDTEFTEETKQLFEEARSKISLYGKKDELKIWYDFVFAYNNHKFLKETYMISFNKLEEMLNKLNRRCHRNIRKELNLKEYNAK